jgi:GTPase Era involved in 16S rRNA processing
MKKKISLKPKRVSAHIKEDKSKREFEEIIQPFFVSGWSHRDYGIDSVVEITSQLDAEGNVELESKCFYVQLKSTDEINVINSSISYSVPVKKILYWYNYNLPVAFILYHIQTNTFYYIWVNDVLIADLDTSNPKWSSQKSISIKIPLKNNFVKSTIDELKGYVSKWKAPMRRILLPGKYFELKDRSLYLLEKYKEITMPFNFSSTIEGIKNLEIDTDQSIYRIALTGLSRVGKSSLINAILEKKVSPTGFFQTTGVPIQVIPGSEEKISIYFHDKPTITIPFKLESIKKYASQDFNEDNKKRVKLVSVSILNKNLDRGVSLFDIPGLDDPDDEILEYTWQTVRKANAIIYVIDATPAENGGFIFKNEYKNHITTFSQSQDKAFLVFNKVDSLSLGKLELLKKRVILDLKKHNLFDCIGEKIFYLSAEKKIGSSGINSISELNDSLWKFILSENKFGIIKLSLVNQELYKDSKAFTQILRTRLLDDKKRKQLESSINKIKSKFPSLTATFTKQKSNAQQLIFSSLDAKKYLLLDNLEKSLKKVPIGSELPSSAALKKFLVDGLYQTMESINNEYVLQVNQLKELIDQWIKENLQQVTEILLDGGNKIVDFTEVETFEAPQIDLKSAWGMGFIGILAGLIISIPGAAIIGGIIGFFGNLFTSTESRRAISINKIMDTSSSKCELIFEKMKDAYSELISEHSVSINGYVNKKLQYFFNDLQSQMNLLTSEIIPSEIKLYDSAFDKIEKLQEELVDFDAELRSYHFNS